MRWVVLVLAVVACHRADDVPASACSGAGGRYDITSSRGPGAERGRSGSVIVTERGETCRLAYGGNGMDAFPAVGLRSGQALDVAWSDATDYGVTVYTIAGGTLSGTEAENQSTTLAAEDLAGPSDLNGSYEVVRGASHDGTPYHGRVTITPAGDVYAMTWEIDCECRKGPHHFSYVGVALARGNQLVAAWSTPGSKLGVARYAVADRTLDGEWTVRAATAVGREALARQ